MDQDTIMGFLIPSILSSTMVSVVMRLSTGRTKNETAFFGANYAVCTLLALFFRAGQMGGSREGTGFAVALGIVSGVMYLASFVLLRKNVIRNGVVLAAVFMKLGVLVPTLMAVLVYHERMKAAGIAGFALALPAIIIVCGDSGAAEGKSSTAENSGEGGSFTEKWLPGKGRGLLLVLLLTGGFTESLTKIYEKHGMPGVKDIYLTGIFATAMLLCVFMTARRKEAVGKRDLFWGMLVGIPNYFSSRFLLLALERLPAVVVYPAYNIGAILLVALAGVLFFRERIGVRKAVGLLMILAALTLLNV